MDQPPLDAVSVSVPLDTSFDERDANRGAGAGMADANIGELGCHVVSSSVAATGPACVVSLAERRGAASTQLEVLCVHRREEVND